MRRARRGSAGEGAHPEDARARLLESGPAVLSDGELVAVLFGGDGDPKNAGEVAARLVRSLNVRQLHRAPLVELLRVPGVDSALAARLLAATEIGRRLWPDGESAAVVRGPETVFELARDIREANREHFVGFYLNSRNQVLRREIISIGSLNASIVHPREVFVPAIAVSAASLILAHNHPSGDSTPSEEDLAITRRLLAAGRLLGIDVLDHVIVTRYGYASFKERRILDA